MNEDERLYEQYEDAFFALLMNRVTEANGKELMQKNEELLADPNAAVPESLSKRCLHTIEKSYRKAQIQKAAKKTLRTLNRVALWILIPLFMFVGVFAASETVRVKTLNYLVETFDFGTSYELFVGQNNLDIPAEDNKARVLNAAPADFILTTGEESETSCIYHFQNSLNEEFEVEIYYVSETNTATVTIDTEDAEVREENLDGQGVSIIHKDNFYQICWIEDTSNLMFVVYGEDYSCVREENISRMEFKMKKRTLRSIAVVLVFCLVIPSFFAMAGAADYSPLRYDTSSLCSAALAISSSNYAECKGTISLYSQYRNGTIDASLALCKSSDQKYWSIDKSWDYNGPGYNGATSAFTITRNRFVESGYYYKVTFVVDVYDSNGTYIETLRAASNVLYV